MEKRTLVLGASINPGKFSNRALRSLKRRNIPAIGIGREASTEDGLDIRSGKPEGIGEIDTVALYMNSEAQKDFYEYILKINPRRIIFNPGTINPELAGMAEKQGIEVVTDCMLVMLNTERY